jgi:hypothetical protein
MLSRNLKHTLFEADGELPFDAECQYGRCRLSVGFRQSRPLQAAIRMDSRLRGNDKTLAGHRHPRESGGPCRVDTAMGL